MAFRLLKWYARLAIKLYCRKIIINKPEWLEADGPLLIAANHPNSFLDGIILTTLFKKPVYSLARGDAFKKEKINKLLRGLHLLPVYRTSEGTENLGHNYTTFAACQEVFAQKGIVLIFSEGRCVNEWHLRPLLKGTARLALSTWQKEMPLTVLPLGFNYNTFQVFGKNVHLNFGTPLQQQSIIEQPTEGKQLLQFNEQLDQQLKGLVYEIEAGDKKTLQQKMGVVVPVWKKLLLALPALIGFILHAPLYYSIKGLTNKFLDNDHYDSVMVALSMLLYPLYLLITFIAAAIIFNVLTALLFFIVLPFTAWSCLQLKPQFD